MIEVKEVELKRLHPNPFRDGQGGSPAATWATVAEHYPYNVKKLEEIKASYQKLGAWVGVHARHRSDGEYELAFGHHRVEAARQLGMKTFPILLGQYSDDQMLNMMAHENSEDYAHDFVLGVMNAVEAVVKAYGAGKVQLERPGSEGSGVRERRDAPSFVVVGSASGLHPYTPTTVGRYLGWTMAGKEGETRAAHRVLTALAALELIETGVLKRSDLVGMGSTAAATVVEAARAARRSREAAADAQRRVLEEARERATKEGNRPRVEKLKEQEAQLDNREKEVKKAVQETARQAVQLLRSGESVREVRDQLVPKLQQTAAAKVKSAQKVAEDGPFTAEDFAKACSRMDSMRSWVEEATPRAAKGKSTVGKKDLAEMAARLVGQLNKLRKVLDE